MKKEVKVLRIIGQCKSGGTEAIALNYYQNLNHNKIKMDFLFYGESLPRFDEALSPNGDHVINVVDYTDNLVGSIKQIRDVIKNNHYDIVHSQLNALNMFPLLGAFLGGTKVRIASNHSTANLKHETKKSIIKYALRSTTKIFATHYAACSEYAGQWCFGKKNLAKGKIKVIHNAIDLEKFRFNQDSRNKVRSAMRWNNMFVIGHVGRFTEQKNHKFMVKIFAKVHQSRPNAILVFAGEGHLMSEIKKQVAELGISDNVQFLGVRFDIDELMQGMDLFLFPSLYEGLGNVITEAQAVGLRCVCSDRIPKEVKMTELVDFLSLDEASEVWADIIIQYANGYLRRDTYNDIKKAGYEIKSAALELENYYMSLVQ